MIDLESPKQGKYLNIENEVYQQANAISNSGLLMVQKSPAHYMWSKNAPRDFSKAGNIDVGTITHRAILEPHLFNDFVVAPVKGRDTIKFQSMIDEMPDKTIVTQSEYDFIRFSVDSVYAHPTASHFLNLGGDAEVSIFVDDGDIKRKIRPDIDLTNVGINALVDVKKTKSIDDWRSFKEWQNPLFALGYGHNAAYYLETASMFYGKQYDDYYFMLVQSSAELGMYPVSVMRVTRSFLESNGFFDQVRVNLDTYRNCLKNNDWQTIEEPPVFADEISFI